MRDYPQGVRCFERHPIPETMGLMHIQPCRDYGSRQKAHTGPTTNKESCLSSVATEKPVFASGISLGILTTLQEVPMCKGSWPATNNLNGVCVGTLPHFILFGNCVCLYVLLVFCLLILICFVEFGLLVGFLFCFCFKEREKLKIGSVGGG